MGFNSGFKGLMGITLNIFYQVDCERLASSILYFSIYVLVPLTWWWSNGTTKMSHKHNSNQTCNVWMLCLCGLGC